MSFKRGIQLAGFARRHLGRMNRGRSEVMAHLSAPSDANLPMPTFVQLRVTNLCNLRCKMCGQWGDTGIYRTDGFPASATDGEKERKRIQELIGAKRQLALSDYTKLLDEIAPIDDVRSTAAYRSSGASSRSAHSAAWLRSRPRCPLRSSSTRRARSTRPRAASTQGSMRSC